MDSAGMGAGAVNNISRELQALYLLSCARNFYPAQLARIITRLGSLEALLEAPDSELGAIELAGGQLTRLREARAGCDPAAEIAALAARGICLIGFGQAGYPELLAQLEDAPLLLYCKGDSRMMLSHGIAVVGSRKCSERGQEFASKLARELAGVGVPVISGLAAGIDGSAHRGALEAPGPTVGVLGCGVDVIYPPEHHQLYAQMCEQALVISEYPPGTPPLGDHFPQRNRIIAGLARGIVVVEGALGSGSLITARLGLAQGREVFAVPGPVASPYTKGTHHLIKKGEAKLIENADDILIEFGSSLAALRKQRYATAALFAGEESGDRSVAVTGMGEAEPAAGFGGTEPAATEIGGTEPESGDRSVAVTGLGLNSAAPPEALEPGELAILEVISYEGTHINEIVRRLGISTSQGIADLTLLEIKGLISSASGGYYVRL